MGIKTGDNVVMIGTEYARGMNPVMQRWLEQGVVLVVRSEAEDYFNAGPDGDRTYKFTKAEKNLAKVRKCSKKQFMKLRKGDVIRARGHSELPASHVDITVVMVEPSSYEGNLPVYLKWGADDNIWPSVKRKATFYIKERADA